MAAATESSDAAPMSLSRRLLSMPQELEGISLPPQVAGDRHGVLTLAVPHILESAAAPRPLPPVSLVRVRWWGEEKPGSLFRPALLSPNAQEGHPEQSGSDESVYSISPRTIAMRYPIHVPADNLLEYFQDMKALQMDVVDRVTRRKFGHCSLSLKVQENAVFAGVRAEDRLATLRRENALCEIVSTSPDEGDTVLGYLAIDFAIQWAEAVRFNDADPSPPIGDIAISYTSPDAHKGSTPAEDSAMETLTSMTSTLPLHERGRNPLPSPPLYVVDERGAYFQRERQSFPDAPEQQRTPFVNAPHTNTNANIKQLIERGKALQQRMEQAVLFADYAEVDQRTTIDAIPESAMQLVSGDGSRAEQASSLLFQDNVGRVPAGRNLQDGNTISTETPRSSDIPFAKEERSEDDSRKAIDPVINVHADSMEMRFEQLEFDDELIEQLRQLRDPSSVTSRFSPIEITVTHTDASQLFLTKEPHIDDGTPRPSSELPAFSVTTSLRKRQWRPNCSKISSIEFTADQSVHGWPDTQRSPGQRLEFHVICENQSDAARRVRRHERGLFPLPTKTIEVYGSVDANELLDRVLRSDVWVAEISLFSAEEGRLPLRGTMKRKSKRKMDPRPVGQLQVKFRLFAAALHAEVDAYRDDSSLLTPESPDISERGRTEPSPIMSSVASSTSTFQNTGARTTNAKIPVSPVFLKSRARKPRKTSHPIAVGSPSEENSLASNGDNSPELMCREQLQFGLMLEKAAVTPGAVFTESEPTEHAVPFVTVQYSVPYHFSTRLSVIRRGDTVERKIKRRFARLQGSTRFAWVADFKGHSNVITSKFHADAADYFDRGILILEIWRGTNEVDHGELLGVAKLAMREFGAFMRDTDLGVFCQQLVPFVAMNGVHSIENLSTGKSIGIVRAQACVGTAEQILVWASTLQAIVSLQAVVRGALTRAHLGVRRTIRPARIQASVSRRTAANHLDKPIDVNRSRLTTPEAATRAATSDQNADKELHNSAVQERTNDRRSKQHISQKLSSPHKIADVRFDIRRCWRDSMRPAAQVEVATANHRTSPIVHGCDVQCCLELLTEAVGDQAKPSDTRSDFAIWWDATDQKLNSYFEVPLPCPTWSAAGSSSEGGGISITADWEGRIVFYLRASIGLFERRPVTAVTGEAELRLDNISFSPLSGLGKRRAVANFDIPIRWINGDSESGYPQSLPLQLSYEDAAGDSLSVTSHAEDHVHTGDETIQLNAISPVVGKPNLRLKLVPADVVLSLTIVHIIDLKSSLIIRAKSAKESLKCALAVKEHLESVLSKDPRHVQVLFDIFLRREHRAGQTPAVGNTLGDMIVSRWRTQSSSASIGDGKQDLCFDSAGLRTKLRILPDHISSLKDNILEVKLLVICGECNALHEIGTASFPTATILFRPNGIQGSFPLRIGKVYAGAIDVHCLVDHSGVGESPVSVEVTTSDDQSTDAEKSNRDALKEPQSPTSPDDINGFDSDPSPTRIEVSINISISQTTQPDSDVTVIDQRAIVRFGQITIEEARNVLVIDDEEDEDDTTSLGAFVSWRVLNGTRDAASPTYHPISRTPVVPLTSSAAWHVSRSSRVSVAACSTPVLEVSLWQQRQREPATAASTIPDRSADAIGSSRLLGKARVDLSLLGRRWMFINGWYHVLDVRGMNRGQVKIRVDLPNGAEARAFDTEDTTAREVRENSMSSPRHGASFHQAVTRIHNNAAEIEQRLLSLQEHSSASSMNEETGYTVEVAELGVQDSRLSLDDEFPSEGQQDKTSAHSKMALAEPFEELSETLSLVVPESDHAQELAPASSISSNEGERINLVSDSQLDAQPLVIETGVFMPITLASFGIEEIEMSPWSEASTKAPGSDLTENEIGSPRFELVEENSDALASLDGSASVQRDRSANVSSVGDEEEEMHELGEGTSATSSIVATVLGHSTSDASLQLEPSVIVAPSNVRDDGTEDNCRGIIKTKDESGTLIIPEQNCGADVVANDQIVERAANNAGAVENGEIEESCGSDVLKLAVSDGSADGDTGDQEQTTPTKAQHSLPLCVDVAVQADFSASSLEGIHAEESSNNDPAARCSSIDVDLQCEPITSVSNAVEQPPPTQLSPANQDDDVSISDASVHCAYDTNRGGDGDIILPPEAVPAASAASHAELVCGSEAPSPVATGRVAMAEATVAGVLSQPTGVFPDGKLDLIVGLLNEILNVCVRSASVSEALSTRQTAQDSSGVPLTCASPPSPEMHDAHTQVEQDFTANPSTIDSPMPDKIGTTLQVNGKTGTPLSEAQLEELHEDLLVSEPPSFPSSTSSREEASGAANIASESQLRAEPQQYHDALADSAAGNAKPPSPRSSISPPLLPLSRTASQSGAALSAVGRLTHELSLLEDSKPLVLLSATASGRTPTKTPHLRVPREARAPLQFPHDSETERIARIMQGSITYWLKESEQGSTESQDESEDSDSDYLF